MTRHNTFTVSVIIPTKNRPSDLELTVRTLLEQTILPAQLIVVDQSADDESHRRVQAQIASCKNPATRSIQVCYVQDESISGGAMARNRAMARASGDIWLFLDDDVCLEPNFLEQIVAVYRSANVVGVSGIVTNYTPPSLISRCWSWLFVRGPFHDDRQPIYWNSENLRDSHPLRVSRLGGGLMSFRADAIRNVRFDENLMGVSDGEDVDFCSRLPEDASLVIAPKARLVHQQSTAGRSRQHWLLRHARANCFIYFKVWRFRRMSWFYFAWLTAGYSIAASLASLRTGTVNPWRDLIEGICQGYLAGWKQTNTGTRALPKNGKVRTMN